MEIIAEASEFNGGYLALGGRESRSRKMQGKMVRPPPKRGAIKKQIFDSIAQAVAEFVRIFTKRGGGLSKQRYYQIMAMASLHFFRKADSKSSLVESMKKLMHMEDANVCSYMGPRLKS